MNKLKLHLIIVAAGSGVRMDTHTPKQFLNMAGETVLAHSINAFKSIDISELVVVSKSEYKDYLERITHDFTFVEGGATRQQSVYNGLCALQERGADKNDFVLIHDAARPLLHKDDLQALVDVLYNKGHRAACLVGRITDSIYNTAENRSENRDDFHAIQTPQGFVFDDILNVHEGAANKNDWSASDDTSLILASGRRVEWVYASHPNFKITTQDDLKMAEFIMKKNNNMPDIRTGSGFDVHAFEHEKTSRKLMLCGIHIEYDYALAGHSDADVGLHAITDALLGAGGLGDIGDHFPPSDDEHKDRDSAEFLEISCNMIRENGFEISNIDVTLICERPKIGPYKNEMRTRIADITGIDASRVNVKATTTEKLGFTGRGEGIAAQASVTILR